jgi:predicted DCC family thiol-disulfide oxidoreductase YuxK
MTSAPAQTAAEGVHLLLYDGVCGLCSRLVQFVLEHDRRALFKFASLQSETGREMVLRAGGNPDELSSLYVFANYRSPEARAFTRSRAALFVVGALGWPWKVAVVLRVLPTALLDRFYDVIAGTRYRLFGRQEQCLIPRPEFRSRFVD